MLYAISSDPLAAAAQGNITVDVFAPRSRWQNHRCSSLPLAHNRCGMCCVQPMLSTHLTAEQWMGHCPSSLPPKHEFRCIALGLWVFVAWLFSGHMQVNLSYWYLQFTWRIEDLDPRKVASVITLCDMWPPCILIVLLAIVLVLLLGLTSFFFFPPPSRDCTACPLGQSTLSCSFPSDLPSMWNSRHTEPSWHCWDSCPKNVKCL